METIKIKAVNTPTETFINCEPFKIILDGNSITFFQQGTLLQDGKEDFFLNEIVYEKDKVSAIEIFYHQFNDQYQVYVYGVGVPDSSDIKIFFDSIEEAQSVYFKIKDWKFK